jgi:hypothetical protein
MERSRAGLPDLSWYNIPKRKKCTKWPENIPNGLKIYQNGRKIYQMDQHLPLQVPPKFTQIRILGLKLRHLAALVPSKPK